MTTHNRRPQLGNCYLHRANIAVASCAVCGKSVCESCLTIDKGQTYCSVHSHPALRRGRRDGWSLDQPNVARRSSKSWSVATALAVTGGLAGLHRIYLGRFISGWLRGALTVIALASAMEVGYFSGSGIGGAVKWFFVIMVIAGCVELFFHICGIDGLFAKYGLGPRLYRKGMRMTGVVYRKPRGKSAPNFHGGTHSSASIILLAAVLAVVFFTRSMQEGVPWRYMTFVAGAALSGILLTKDLILLRRNSLTDSDGGVLQ